MRFLIVGICMILSSPCFAVSGGTLVEKARDFDGQTVEFQGEVIGDIMARGDYVWMNVNDGTRSIGIWAGQDLIQEIKRTGNYNNIGDRIRIIGTFNRACPQHGGDLDIHALEIEVIGKGYGVVHPVNPAKIIISGMLLAGALILFFLPKLFKA